MNRNRKRRINCEAELLEGSIHDSHSYSHAPSRGKVNFMEEVNYKMEEGCEMEEVSYVMIPNLER